MRDEDERLARALELARTSRGPVRERLVADREHLVDEEHVGIAVRGDREAEPHGHSGRVGLHGRVEELLDAGKPHDRRRTGPRSRCFDRPSSRPVISMFSRPGDLRVESGAELEQRGEAARDGDGPARRPHDAGEQLEQRRLAGAVRPDDARATRPARPSKVTSVEAATDAGRSRPRPRRRDRRADFSVPWAPRARSGGRAWSTSGDRDRRARARSCLLRERVPQALEDGASDRERDDAPCPTSRASPPPEPAGRRRACRGSPRRSVAKGLAPQQPAPALGHRLDRDRGPASGRTRGSAGSPTMSRTSPKWTESAETASASPKTVSASSARTSGNSQHRRPRRHGAPRGGERDRRRQHRQREEEVRPGAPTRRPRETPRARPSSCAGAARCERNVSTASMQRRGDEAPDEHAPEEEERVRLHVAPAARTRSGTRSHRRAGAAAGSQGPEEPERAAAVARGELAAREGGHEGALRAGAAQGLQLAVTVSVSFGDRPYTPRRGSRRVFSHRGALPTPRADAPASPAGRSGRSTRARSPSSRWTALDLEVAAGEFLALVGDVGQRQVDAPAPARRRSTGRPPARSGSAGGDIGGAAREGAACSTAGARSAWSSSSSTSCPT